jgi:hypothetical protein
MELSGAQLGLQTEMSGAQLGLQTEMSGGQLKKIKLSL